MRWKSGLVHTINSVTKETNVQECNNLKAMCILTVLLSWPTFVPKLTSTLTGNENKKILGMTHVVPFLRHLLTHPLERGEAIGQHDFGVQILTDVHVSLHDAWISHNCWNVLRDDEMDPPYWALSIVNKHFNSLKRSAVVFRSPNSLVRKNQSTKTL